MGDRIDPTAHLLDLAAVLAHDIKNPLAALITNLCFLKDALGDEVDAEVLAAVADGLALCASLDRYASNLDVLARAAVRRVHPVALAVRDACEEIVARNATEAKQAGVVIGNRCDGDVIAVVDKDLFARALDNLVANALEHAPRGTDIVLRCVARDEQVFVTVVDRGGAIPEALRAASVDPIEQAALRRHGGTRAGRGLSLLSAAIATRAMGGELEIGGEGSESRLTLVMRCGAPSSR